MGGGPIPAVPASCVLVVLARWDPKVGYDLHIVFMWQERVIPYITDRDLCCPSQLPVLSLQVPLTLQVGKVGDLQHSDLRYLSR